VKYSWLKMRASVAGGASTAAQATLPGLKSDCAASSKRRAPLQPSNLRTSLPFTSWARPVRCTSWPLSMWRERRAPAPFTRTNLCGPDAGCGGSGGERTGSRASSGNNPSDIKPENIMLRTDGNVKYWTLDWPSSPSQKQANLRRLLLPQVETAPGVVMGTFSYMSPEQARGLTVEC